MNDIENKVDKETFERYKNGPGDSYISYIEKRMENQEMDWPLEYLKRRSTLKKGKQNEEHWIKETFKSVGPKKTFDNVEYIKSNGEPAIGTAIPDYSQNGQIGDVKDVEDQSFTDQLRIIAAAAEQNNMKFSLIVRNNEHPKKETKISKPLKEAAKIHRTIKY